MCHLKHEELRFSSFFIVEEYDEKLRSIVENIICP